MKTKKGFGFFMIWLIIYLIMINASTVLSQAVGINNLFTAVFGCLFVIVMLLYLKKHQLLTYYGLKPLNKMNYQKLLYLIPLIIYGSSNLWYGIHLDGTLDQLLLITVSMLCVGFAEEMIFRSFLIKSLRHKRDITAVSVSAVLFGGLHLLNVLGGADLFLTLLQVLNTTAFGFMCAAFYCKTNHILPCILCHGLYNTFDIFMPTESLDVMFLGEAIVIIIAFAYGIYLIKTDNSMIKTPCIPIID